MESSAPSQLLGALLALRSLCSASPVPIWADANNKFFGFSFFLSWLPEAYAGEHAKITEAQTAALSARAPELYKKLLIPLRLSQLKIWKVFETCLNLKTAALLLNLAFIWLSSLNL